MVDLRKCKFGTLLKTRSGEPAVFLCRTPEIAESYTCAVLYTKNDYFTINYHRDGTRIYSYHREDKDIIGYWEE